MTDSKKERVHRFVSKDFTIRIAAVDATEVVKTMQTLQDMYPLPAVAVGRAMVGALLLASHLKEDQQVGLLFKGNGVMGSIYAEADFNGRVRGYTPHAHYTPASYEGGLQLKSHVGSGTLSVTRHLPFQKQPHHGTVAMDSGEIGEDIAHYLNQSHQIRSLVSLGVYIDTYGKVRAAGGLIIEVMPGVEDEIVEKIQKNAEKTKMEVSKVLFEGGKAVDLIRPYLEGIEFTEIPHDYPIEYYCPCTKERVVRALETLGEAELQDMIDKNEVADVTCQMCGRPYEVSVEELQTLKDRLHKASLH